MVELALQEAVTKRLCTQQPNSKNTANTSEQVQVTAVFESVAKRYRATNLLCLVYFCPCQ